MDLTFLKNSLNSLLCLIFSGEFAKPDSLIVSCKNFAISNRTFNSLRFFSSAACLSSKVDGSMFGNNFNATGSKNSMNGMTTKGMNGIRRSKS